MKNIFRHYLKIAFHFLLFAGVVIAQTGGAYEIKQSVIAGGGQKSAGGQFSLDGTIGQPAAGTVSSGGVFSLYSGFWSASGFSSTLSISGQVTNNGNPLTGVLIALSGGASASTQTDAQGFYSFQNLSPGGSYTVAPALTGYSFTPSFVTFNNLTSNQTANFSASSSNCGYSISPTGVGIGAAGGSQTVSVTTAAGCSWTALSNDDWITVTNASSGTGAGTVSYSVAANSGAARSGSITIAGYSFIISQTGSAVTHSISGAVIYATTPDTQPSKFVSGVLMSVNGASSASSLTNLSGSYLLDNLISGGNYTITPSKSGQLNGISNADATAVAQSVAGLITLTPNQQMAADVSGNGTVSSLDATYIAQFVVSTPNPGLTGMWRFAPANRSYPNLQTNLTNENYSAVLLGEVTGNWNPSAPEVEEESDKQAAERQRQEIRSYDDPIFGEGGAGPVTVSAPNPKVVNPAENFVIELNASDTTGRGIFGYEFNFLYDPAVIVPQAIPCDASGTLSDTAIGRTVICNPVSPGLLRVVMFSSTGTPVSGAGVLLKLNFTAVGAPNSTSALTFQNFMFNEGEPAAVTVNGQVWIAGPTSASATVGGRVLTPTGRGLMNATVVMTDISGRERETRTSSFGYYRFEAVEVGGTYVLSVRSKRYLFSAQAVTVNEQLAELNFTAIGEQRSVRK